ncbi:MAG TPA: exodeoxyribonuclease VII large subunit, partial [Clostridia bacterium]|nr:exodeoxyribonuclease VII large subunit [Clostridia bacterium]
MNTVVTVSQLNNYVQSLMDSDINLRNISVRGEISGFKHHSSGYMYFTLKDSQALIKCVMFRQYNAFLRFKPCDGMAMIVTGNVSLYPRDGQYQLYVSKMVNDGEGALYIAFERLKALLSEEGLFNPEVKKPIPIYAKKIAVITSPTGSVIRDIIHVATRRFPAIQIVLYPVKVQGEGASEDIAEALAEVNKREDIDVVIVG